MDISADLIRSLGEDRAPEPAITVIGDLGYDYIYTSPILEPEKEVIIRSMTHTIAGAAGSSGCGTIFRSGTGTRITDKCLGCQELLGLLHRTKFPSHCSRISRRHLFEDHHAPLPHSPARLRHPFLGRRSSSRLRRASL